MLMFSFIIAFNLLLPPNTHHFIAVILNRFLNPYQSTGWQMAGYIETEKNIIPLELNSFSSEKQQRCCYGNEGHHDNSKQPPRMVTE